MIASKGGASEPPNTLQLGKAGGAAAVRRILDTTICRIADPTLVARPRQLRDASPVMRFRPAHQRMINRRHDGCASSLARQSPKQLLPREPQIHAPATWKGGHESVMNQKFLSTLGLDGDRAVTKPFDGGQDVVGGFGPAEGLGVGIAGVDVGGDGGLQRGGRAVGAALDLLVGEQGKEALDLVDPRRGCRA